MLRFLRITHLAVIDSVEVEFDTGLNVLTGETGAGKSILVEAVGLLLGGRASGDLVRTGEDSANVEAIFERDGEEILIRREVTAQGRSRAFINGALTTAGGLKEIAAGLIELHGQHEHHTLLDPATHVDVVDQFGQLEPLLMPTRAAFDTLCGVNEELAQVRRSIAERGARAELIAFQLTELDRADIRAEQSGEDVELAAVRQVLASAERIEGLCTEVYSQLYERDDAILAGLGNVWRRVSELATLDARFQPYVEARDGIKAQLEDLALFLRRYAEGIDASPARLQQVEDRLALLERLKRKYGPSLPDVISRHEALRRERRELEGADDRITELEQLVARAEQEYRAHAERLSAARRGAAEMLARQLEKLLAELAMDRTRVEVRFGEPLPPAAWTGRGIDAVELYIAPNVGEELRPLARIVSGGELSRIMLAIKTLTFRARLASIDTEAVGAPGMIFDEVDAGIGGRVADVVGRTMRTLGAACQVLCITHLPQIAAYADTHVQIDKRVERGRTSTFVTRLDAEGRVTEIARMLGGEAISDSLRASAREMLSERGRAKGEHKGKGESERSKAKPRSART